MAESEGFDTSTAGALLIRNTILTRVSEQLHGQRSWPLHKWNGALAEWNDFTSKSSLKFGEDLKKTCGFAVAAWREALRLRSPFFCKKNGGWKILSPPAILNRFWGKKLRISLWNEILKIVSTSVRKTQNDWSFFWLFSVSDGSAVRVHCVKNKIRIVMIAVNSNNGNKTILPRKITRFSELSYLMVESK